MGGAMAKKEYLKWEKFAGVNEGLDSLEGQDFLVSMQNFDSNVIDGQLVSRKGFSEALSGTIATPGNFICYRDEEWGKDVIIKHTNGAFYVYTKTLGTDGVFAFYSLYSWGGSHPASGNPVFLLDRNIVRLGNGAAEDRKVAHTMGYIDRSTASGRAMFNDTVSFNDFFMKKQQWVRQGDLFGGVVGFDYDATKKKWYFLTNRGLEVRDERMHIETVLEGVIAWSRQVQGSIHFKSNDLYALGQMNTASTNTKIIRYDIEDEYGTIANSLEYTTAGHIAYGVCTDGTNVFVSIDENGTFVVRRYAMDLTSGTIIYTATGSDFWWGAITCDQTATTGYCYVGERNNNDVHRFKKDGTTVYNSDTLSAHASSAIQDLDFYNSRIYWVVFNGNVYSNAADMTGVITTEKTDAFTLPETDNRITVDQASGDAYSSNPSGFITQYTSATDWTIEDSWGGHIVIKQLTNTGQINKPTRFYGYSIVDIYGQEHHLQSGMAFHETDGTAVVLSIYVNTWLEKYAFPPGYGTGHDPTSQDSIWNEFRTISKIRIYRATNSTNNSANEATSYFFLTEIDINDLNWTELTTGRQYQIYFRDETAASDISSITYTDNSGLPQSFKPYYTNWTYGKSFQGSFYYGNVRTDDLYPQQIVKTPLNSPDIVYQLPTNIDIFGTSDGDEIKGFAESWQRLIIFKGNKTAIYNGLVREKVYNCGLQAIDSIVEWNNLIFFLFRNGIYQLSPSGYRRISLPIDRLLADETTSNLASMSATFYEEREKVWFHVHESKSYLYNIKKGTWDIYDLNHSGKEVTYVDTGIDGKVFFSSNNSDQCYEFANADTDDTSAIKLKAKTHLKQPGAGFLESIIFRKFIAFTYGGTVTNPNFEALIDNTAYQDTFTTQTLLRPIYQFLSNAFGSMVQMHFELDADAEARISSMGVEYSTNKFARTKQE